jgi:signal peptidase II
MMTLLSQHYPLPTALRRWALHPLMALVAAVLVCDQLTKYLLLHHLPLHTARELIPGFFNLVHVRNTGAAFSLLAGANTAWRQIFFVTVSILALGAILFLLARTNKEDCWSRRALVLIFSGALGNLVDRLRFGEVVDFLDFYLGGYHWPAFNIADSAITIGACILFLTLLKSK